MKKFLKENGMVIIIYMIITILLVCIACVAIHVIQTNKKMGVDISKPPKYDTYYCMYRTVNCGDTLWSISTELKLEYPEMKNLDTRVLVNFIEDNNGIFNEVKAGNQIVIPVWLPKNKKVNPEKYFPGFTTKYNY
jgi:hypothetical protein